MSFWDAVVHFAWREESFLALTVMLCLAFLLLTYLKDDRRIIINTLNFFLICIAGQFISGLFHAFEFSITASVLQEVFIIGGGIALIRLWGMLIFRMALPLAHMEWPRLAEDVFVIIAYMAWGLVRLRYAGLDLGSIVATSAMITAVVAFSMQDTLGNILGGLALQLDNSIEIGDWVKVDDISGRVVDIRWRSTLVETRNGETVVFPNSQLMKNKFLVLGRRNELPARLRRWVWFGVNLNVTPARVIRVVEEALQRAEIANVAKTPVPNCVLMEIDKGYGRYALRYWLTDLATDDPTDGIMRWHVFTALERAGIKLADQNVQFVREREKHEADHFQDELKRRIKTLKRVELFQQMTDEELHKLAERLRYAPFAKGSILTRQGESGKHRLFVIINGEVEVYLEMANGEKRTLNVLGAGHFFGEMSLMTGAPRVASVIARTDVECYRLDKAAVEEIMRERPNIAEEISQILVERRAQLDTALQDLDREVLPEEIPHQHNEVLAMVKRFFGL